MSENDHIANASLGAIVTMFSAFVTYAPVIGGGVAGYRNGRDGIAVGAVSGIFAAAPIILLGLAAEGNFGSVRFIGEILSSTVGLGEFEVTYVAKQMGLFVLYTVGMGAGGGYIGAMLHNPD